jgi:hypothetical protein
MFKSIQTGGVLSHSTLIFSPAVEHKIKAQKFKYIFKIINNFVFIWRSQWDKTLGSKFDYIWVIDTVICFDNYCIPFFRTCIIHKCNERFRLLLRQIFLIQNRANKCTDLRMQCFTVCSNQFIQNIRSNRRFISLELLNHILAPKTTCLDANDWVCLTLSLSFLLLPLLEHRASVKSCVSLQVLSSKTVGRTPWTGDLPIARQLPTQEKTNRINAHRHPCLEWDSNRWFQCSSGRRQFMP